MTRARRWRRAAVLATAVLGVYIAMVFGLQRMMVFPRHLVVPDANPGADVPGLQRMWLDTDDGRVEAWFLPGEGVSAESPGPLVVFAHGNAELIEHWPQPLSHYRERGVSVLLPEYRGYGRSAGSPSQRAIVDDFVAWYDRAVARPEVDADRVILHGRSLGGGVVVGLATRRPAAALILQSTFTSVADLARRFLVPRFLVLDPFDNVEALREVEAPVLIVHGRRDSIIPFTHAEALEKAARSATFVAYDADHNDCPPSWSTFWRDVDGFLRDECAW